MKTTPRINPLQRPTPMIALAIGLTLSAGCTLDRGIALADKFEDDWAGTPEVAEIDTKYDNTLPFVGTADGWLVLDDDTSTDRVIELAGELQSYVADRDAVTGGIEVDGFAFAVSADEGRTERILGMWRSLASDDRVVQAEIVMATGKEDKWVVKVAAVDEAGASAVFDDMMADGSEYRLFAASVPTSLDIGVSTGLLGRL